MSSYKKTKIVLISPAQLAEKRGAKRIVPPLGLAYIAAVLEKNDFDVHILDVALEGYDTEIKKNNVIIYGLKDEEIKTKIKEENPDFVGVSMSLSLYSAQSHNICKLVKEINEEIIVVVGGIHASALPREVLQDENIDYVVIGEGEYTFLELLGNISNKNEIKGIAYRDKNEIVINPKRAPIDINKLPFPARHLLDMEKYIKLNKPHYFLSKGKRVAGIITSRGCNFNCSYCASTKFFGKWKGMSSEKVIEEIDYLIKKYNVDEIQFEDDNMTFNRERAVKIFIELKKYNVSFCFPNGIIINYVDKELLKLMKEAGCYSVIYGVEVGNKNVLRKIIKKPLVFEKIKELIDITKKEGIFTNIFLMVGLPGETKGNIKETFEFAKYLRPDNVFLSIFNPLPGSELYDVCIEKNYLNKDFEFQNIIYVKGNISTDEFSSDWLEKYAIKQKVFLNSHLLLQRWLQKVIKN